MIIVKLMGGLGNQMFQYAIGRSLAVKTNQELKFDLSFLSDKSPKINFTFRELELDKFNINLEFSSIEENRFFINKLSILNKILFKLNLKSSNLYIVENPHKQLNISNINGDVYLDGFWQSEYYFCDIRNYLLNDFSLSILSNEVSLLTDEIIRNSSVSIHIRRGDYSSNSHINSYHGTCNIEYYLKAISYFSNKLANPIFYFFSDDINWVKDNFESKQNFRFISLKDSKSPHYDMYLMSKCLHNVIANSSFSWWGAWLNQNPNKTVIAPINWFVNPSNNPIDLIPQNWIRL